MKTLMQEQAEKAAAGRRSTSHSPSSFDTVEWHIKHAMGVPDIRSFDDACRHWDEQPIVRGNLVEKPAGLTTARNRRMNRYDDGSIGFSYYGEELAVWHPDGTLTVMAASQQRNGTFDQRVRPKGVLSSIGTRCGPVVYSAPVTESSNGYFYGSIRVEIKDEEGHTTYGPNPDCIVFRGHRPVKMQLVGERWDPIEPEKIEPFEWGDLNKAKARQLSADAGIPDFLTALRAVTKLAGLPPKSSVVMSDDELLCRLRERDFGAVLGQLQRTRQSRWISGRGNVLGDETIASSEIERVRRIVYQAGGALEPNRAHMLPYPDYHRVEGQMRRFKQAPRYGR